MAESYLLSSPSSLFPNKTKHHFSKIPSKQSLKLQLSCFNPSLSFSSLSLTTTTHRLPFLTFVAQTSDWAQQEDNDTVTFEEEQEVEGRVGETEAALSDWEPNGEDAEIDGGEEGEGEEEGEEGDFEEPPEDAKLFVGNLPYDVDSQKLAMLFEQAGTVEIAEVSENR